jgi:glycosyltransferase involved in cell wall biosynthesis
MKNVSIIICAYNEAETIAQVVISCCSCNPLSQVIVVDDGSTDGTSEILENLRKRFYFQIERLPQNRGKSWAMVHGVEHADRDIILFFDADVRNITKKHFISLFTPLIDGTADMVLGQPKETMIDYRLNPFKSLTGERSMFRKDLLPVLEDMREIRFGVETFINLYYEAQGKRISYVLLDGLMHPNTFEKTSPIKATRKYLREGHEIAMTYMNNYKLLMTRLEARIHKNNQRTMGRVSWIRQQKEQGSMS